jgi:hypothetical protein
VKITVNVFASWICVIKTIALFGFLRSTMTLDACSLPVMICFFLKELFKLVQYLTESPLLLTLRRWSCIDFLECLVC